MQKNTFIAGFSFMALAVMLGAFGAHGLKSIITAQNIEIFKTGVTYQFYHALGILILGLLSVHLKTNDFKISIYLMILGIFMFSGSLYILAFSDVSTFNLKLIGPVTPLGGLCFIVAWLLALKNILKKSF